MSTPASAKVKLTPEQRSTFKAIRERAEIDRPGPAELVEQGAVAEFVSQGAYMELLAWIDALRRERKRRGLSLSELAQRSGLTRAMVSQLENGRNPNPTLDTLARSALGLDMQVQLSAQPIAESEAE